MRVRLLALLALFSATAAATPDPPVAGEYEVKAAFLYNFTRFVEWPPEAFDGGSPLAICVLGQDPFGSDLDRAVEGRTVNGRPLIVKRLRLGEGAAHCHILFIGTTEPGYLKHTIDGVQKSSVLTVGDDPEFLRAGGIIGFVMRENKVHFTINLPAATRAGIKISSKLLKLADFVIGEPGAGK